MKGYEKSKFTPSPSNGHAWKLKSIRLSDKWNSGFFSHGIPVKKYSTRSTTDLNKIP